MHYSTLIVIDYQFLSIISTSQSNDITVVTVPFTMLFFFNTEMLFLNVLKALCLLNFEGHHKDLNIAL